MSSRTGSKLISPRPARSVVSELKALLAACPLRERLQRQLMVALYRCGRQPDALAAYQSARRMMRDELGIEPAQRCSVRACDPGT